MAKSPAFRFYPSDFLGSPDVQIMDATEIGAYWLLLCTAWLSDQHGHLPDDHDRLRRWARLSHEQWERSKDILLSKFPLAEDGTRHNPRMVEEAEKQRLYSEVQSRKGKSGGRPQKKLELFPEKPELQKRKPNLAVKKAGVKPSVSVSVSASVSGEEQKQKPSRDKREDTVSPPEELPPFVDRTAWDAYVEMRRKKRCPMTPRARELILAKLEELREAGDDPSAVLDQSVMNGYQGIFALKGGSSNGTNRKYLEQQAALDEGFRQFDQRYAAQNANAGTKGVLSVTDATPGYRP